MILKKSWSTSKGSNWQLELAYDGRLPDSLFVYYCTRGRGSGSKMTAQPKLLNLKMVRTCLSMMEWNSIKKVAVWHSPSLPLCVGCTPILLQSSFFCILWRQYIHMHLLCLLCSVIIGVIFSFFSLLSFFFVSIDRLLFPWRYHRAEWLIGTPLKKWQHGTLPRFLSLLALGNT